MYYDTPETYVFLSRLLLVLKISKNPDLDLRHYSSDREEHTDNCNAIKKLLGMPTTRVSRSRDAALFPNYPRQNPSLTLKWLEPNVVKTTVHTLDFSEGWLCAAIRELYKYESCFETLRQIHAGNDLQFAVLFHPYEHIISTHAVVRGLIFDSHCMPVHLASWQALLTIANAQSQQLMDEGDDDSDSENMSISPSS